MKNFGNFFSKNFRQFAKNLDPVDQNRIRILFCTLNGAKVHFAPESWKKKSLPLRECSTCVEEFWTIGERSDCNGEY